MPNMKPHVPTSNDGLRRKSTNPYNKPAETSYEQTYFPLPPTQFPTGTPATSERSKKVYSDLLDERAFLLELRNQWAQKLQDLKEDHKFLSKMKSIKKQEILGIEPLFTREEKEPSPPPPPPSPPIQYPTTASNYILSPLSSASQLYLPQRLNQPNRRDSPVINNDSISAIGNDTISSIDNDTTSPIGNDSISPIDNDSISVTGPDIFSAYAELEGLYSDENEDEEEEDEEDEERARIALNLMLQEFGNSI